MGNGIVTNTDYDQKDSEGTWHRTRQVFRTPVMHPDRIYSYFLREWKTLLIVAVSGTLFNLGQSLCAMRQGQLVDAIAAQEKLAYYLMKLIGLDTDHVALATTEHPFTTSLGSHLDERITTHYYPEDYTFSMYSVIHEGGHALYDTGSDDELAFTVLDGGVSMGIHESQSRFYENILGRSKEFIRFLFPKLKELFPEHLKNYDWIDVYKAVNRVEPSLIRTEADEVTYSLHVMIRYELEKRIMSGELKVHDLPGEWNRLYREYLGIDVPDDKHGVLQDSHWSFGAIGYFPSYALGSAYGAQFLKKMKETVDVDAALARGDFVPMNEWNRGKIWHHGSSKTPDQILNETLGEAFDPSVYLDYLD